MTERIIKLVKDSVFRSLLTDVDVRMRADGYIQIDTPFEFSDGDSYQLFAKSVGAAGFRLSDRGTTLLHLSYEVDLDKIRDGQRARILEQVAAEGGVCHENGEFFLDVPADVLGPAVVRLGQVLTRIHDLNFLTKERTATTFYEDLAEEIYQIVSQEGRVIRNYIVPGVPRAQDYPVDFRIDGANQLFVFGIPSQDKARLATIVLQHLNHHVPNQFRSLAVFQDMSAIPRADLSRLSNASDMTVDTLAARDDLRRKVEGAIG